MTPKELKSLVNKLRQPIHITYISKYIVKKDLNETEIILNQLISEGVIKETKTSPGYYVIT